MYRFQCSLFCWLSFLHNVSSGLYRLADAGIGTAAANQTAQRDVNLLGSLLVGRLGQAGVKDFDGLFEKCILPGQVDGAISFADLFFHGIRRDDMIEACRI